tara:strand:+ start:209 stop:1261 length:1053 start_codon:yes stop_codon:yes gene_type:complete
MKTLYSNNTYLLLLLSFLLISCDSGKKEQKKPEIQQIKIDQPEVAANFDSHGLVQPSAINVMENGNVVTIDGSRKEVLILKPNGELKSKFGREGKGPGEFVMPLDIQFVGNAINIIDVNQYKVIKFDNEGSFIDSYSYETKSAKRNIVLLADQTYVSNASGLNNHLLEIVNLTNDSTLYFGEAKGEPVEVVDLQKEIKALSNREIPSIFKNFTTLFHENEFIYAFLDSYSELRKYSLSGDLIWEKSIELPYNEEIFDSLVEANKGIQGRLIAITYIYDLNVVNESVYLLTKKTKDKPQLIVKIDSNGDTDSIYTLPDSESYFTGFAFDKERELVYFTSTDGEIVKAVFKF